MAMGVRVIVTMTMVMGLSMIDGVQVSIVYSVIWMRFCGIEEEVAERVVKKILGIDSDIVSYLGLQ